MPIDVKDILNKVRSIIYAGDIRDKILKLHRGEGLIAEYAEFLPLRYYFAWLATEINIWAGIGNHGKALDINTDISTIDGWKKMEHIEVGDIRSIIAFREKCAKILENTCIAVKKQLTDNNNTLLHLKM